MLLEFSEDVVDRFWSKVQKSDGCWEWTAGKYANGYGCFHIYGDPIKAHRFSWMIHYGEFSPEMNVCHKCDNKSCVRPDHLFLGTQVDNILDAVRKGRRMGAIGYKSPERKLTEEDVRNIRNSKSSSYRLAEAFGVSGPTIRQILQGKTYKEVI